MSKAVATAASPDDGGKRDPPARIGQFKVRITGTKPLIYSRFARGWEPPVRK